MIPVQRLACPDILTRKEAEWTVELCRERFAYYQELQKYRSGQQTTKPHRPDAVHDRYAHDQVKAQLKEMFQGKCAYCESPVAASSHLHVEHFRPQSIYPGLAYHWNNMLYACGRCNSDHKGNQFPLSGGIQPVEDAQNPCRLSDTDANELINPCDEDPVDFFSFTNEYIACKDDRAKITRDVCELNREDLKELRRLLLVCVEGIVKLYKVNLLSGDQQEISTSSDTLKTVTSPKYPYSAMIRAKVAAMGVDINNLP